MRKKLAMTIAQFFKAHNIGVETPVHLLTFIETIEKALGKTAEKNMLPMQPGDVEATYADVESLSNDVGYRPSVSLEQGISEFVAWYIGFYGKRPLNLAI